MIQVLDMVKELTSPTKHSEQISQPQHNGDGTITWHTTRHNTTHPPLLDQLRDTTQQTAAPGDLAGKPTFGSKPPTRLDAIDAYTRIDLAAARWVRELGEDDPGDTAACVLKLSGLAASAHCCMKRPALKNGDECCTVHAIERDIRSWWTQARILAGWDRPAWEPDNTCPLCARKGGLRIKLEAQTAMCTACHETWTPDEIGLLAQHMRLENADLEEEPA